MTLILGHRGASGYAPENTMSSFKLAILQNADGLEFDVHLSKDNIPVVIHDRTINRTTNGSGLVAEYTASELQQFDAGSWYGKKFRGFKIPLLAEVLQLCKVVDKQLLLNIELKAGSKMYKNIERIVIDMVSEYRLEKQVIISSFDHFALQRVKEINPNIKTGVLYAASWIKPWRYREVLNFNALHPAWHTLTPELLKHCHEAGLAVNTYTVNDTKYVDQMIALGVDGIITNYPNKLIACRDEIKYKE
ncbi:glycerophosphodiester phosphodiesterase [Clostridium sp. 'deep sea']|uniref:glycerophosphodiester phosphodiesterase n=1 Tax=Clostridium sp. 'deep sea' TaxID=2779445 RepID=UPI0018968590|nr:glycerophosphodiester phosphodiesterase [Clostridium sp. 'deep sea']QOR34702.1 glycerophosphodiester phosphodiesterase [Clostridium sp. 'deep sea']